MSIEVGIKGKIEADVTYEMTALALGSGSQEVLSTPSMIAMMESAALNSVSPFLEPGQDTVGTLMNVKHLQAVPVGVHVYAESELLEIDRKRLTFTVRAYCGEDLLGEGSHERFIIDAEKFMGKCKARYGK